MGVLPSLLLCYIKGGSVPSTNRKVRFPLHKVHSSRVRDESANDRHFVHGFLTRRMSGTMPRFLRCLPLHSWSFPEISQNVGASAVVNELHSLLRDWLQAIVTPSGNPGQWIRRFASRVASLEARAPQRERYLSKILSQ